MTTRLDRKAVGISTGLIAGFIVFFIGLAGAFGLARETVSFVEEFYIGFGPTFTGSLIGFLWAFIEGFVLGFVYAWIYNTLIGSSD